MPDWLTWGSEGWGLVFAAAIWAALGLTSGGVGFILKLMDAPIWSAIPFAVMSVVFVGFSIWVMVAGG